MIIKYYQLVCDYCNCTIDDFHYRPKGKVHYCDKECKSKSRIKRRETGSLNTVNKNHSQEKQKKESMPQESGVTNESSITNTYSQLPEDLCVMGKDNTPSDSHPEKLNYPVDTSKSKEKKQ